MPIFHIGCPRTGTTSLQKNIFNKSNANTFLSKDAYSSSAKQALPGIVDNNFLQSQTTSDTSLLKPKEIFDQIFFCALKLAVDGTRKEYSDKLISLIKLCNKSLKGKIVISSERFCDSSASLQGDSRHQENSDKIFAIIATLIALKATNIKTSSLVTLCLRDPIQYIRSKYIRTIFQRKIMSLRHLTPSEYIQKQSILETNHPGTSALTPAMHAEFIKQLQQHAFVKAFGFQELLASDDVFSLMGLQGEDKYAFRDFPRENKLPFTKEQEQEIEIEITQALKAYGFYDRIMKAQMFK